MGQNSNMAEMKTRSQPTINDVAAEAGVSKKTVSRVINRSPLLTDATREKVEEAIKSLGFVPNPQARALALRRNFLIVLLHDNPNAQTVQNFQKGVFSAINDTDLALVVRPVERNSPDILDDVRNFLEKQRPLAAILLPPISERDDVAGLCEELGVRYVRIGSAILDGSSKCVASNDRQIVREACSHLTRRGHKVIGFVRGPQGFRSALEREAGFLAAMADAGLDYDKKLTIEGNYRFESGLMAAGALLDNHEPPTAIFCSNDEMAAGSLHAVKVRNLNVPNDVSIIGFDNSPIAAHIWPPMTTVGWPIRQMAKAAALKLIAPTDDDARKCMFPAQLVHRQSVSRPSKKFDT